ncbi:hypothetical protein D1814_10770 [Alteromonas sp. BL110]|nr:hypothetical protein D1814_10770 [Alteromonas sp. BL110]RKM85216.1 hypothetical protein D7031_00320 [Alteromonas sp. BL110]
MAPVTSESGTEFQHGLSRHTEWYDLNKIRAIAQEILWYKRGYEKATRRWLLLNLFLINKAF